MKNSMNQIRYFLAGLVMVATWGLERKQHTQNDAGQSTTEYALLLLGAATIALLVVTWATSTDLIGKLFDGVIRTITKKTG